jgi:hypothetical protein
MLSAATRSTHYCSDILLVLSGAISFQQGPVHLTSCCIGLIAVLCSSSKMSKHDCVQLRLDCGAMFVEQNDQA